ncbi:MAG: ABC transporter ATP-binding protein, partial [Actinophytocola sp.]
RVVLELLRSMVDAANQTIVMVTHDPAVAARADSVLFLSDGRIVDHLTRPSVRQVADRLAALED